MCRVLVSVAVLLLGAHLAGISLWPCWFARLTGRPCPGCGMTRAITALLRGDWASMTAFHPFAPFFLCVAVLVFLCAMLPASFAGKIARGTEVIEQRTAIPALTMLLFLCFGLLRMAGLCDNEARDQLVPRTSALHLLRSPQIHQPTNP